MTENIFRQIANNFHLATHWISSKLKLKYDGIIPWQYFETNVIKLKPNEIEQ